jgi:hypothetical protein
MQADGGQPGLGAPAKAVLGALAVLAALVALAAVLDLGPFGGDDDETATLTEAQFIAKGDEICEEAHDQFAELQKTPPNSAEGAATLTQNLIEISEEELSKIHSLDVPADLVPALNRYLRAREQGIALLEQGLEAAEQENATAYANAQAKIADGQLGRLRLAEAVGFTECSRVSADEAGDGQ